MTQTQSGDLGDGTFLNPILRGNYADPSIIRVDHDYYMVHTSYKYVPGLIVWHSNDLVNWSPIGIALEHFNGDVWAPELVYHQNTFYIYFPADKTNWVTTAKDPSGPWSKPKNLNTKYIDPGHVVGPDHNRYLHLSGGHMVQLSDDGLSVVGNIQHVYEPWKYPKEWEVEAFSPEGPKLTYRQGYYYMTLALGGTAGPPTSHMVACSRSKTPWGPWEHSPYNPVIRTTSKHEYWWSQGHGTLIDTPNGDWWMVFHAYENRFHTLGRQTMLLPIEWTEDGWYKVPDRIDPEKPIPLPITGRKGSEHGLPLEDSFQSDQLGLHWQWLGEPDRERITPSQNGLTIKGIGADRNSPILYMPGHQAYEVEVDVAIHGEAEGRLMLFYNEEAYFGIGVSPEGIRHFRTFKNYRVVPCNRDWVRLRIRNDHHIISFYFMDEQEEWIKYDKVLDASGFHHNTFGGFLSLRVGLDTVGNGDAIYKDFKYRVL